MYVRVKNVYTDARCIGSFGKLGRAARLYWLRYTYMYDSCVARQTVSATVALVRVMYGAVIRAQCGGIAVWARGVWGSGAIWGGH